MQQHSEPTSTIAAKAAPVVGYMGASFGGMSLPDWASLLAIIYTLGLLIQQAYRLYQWDQSRKSKRRAASAR